MTTQRYVYLVVILFYRILLPYFSPAPLSSSVKALYKSHWLIDWLIERRDGGSRSTWSWSVTVMRDGIETRSPGWALSEMLAGYRDWLNVGLSSFTSSTVTVTRAWADTDSLTIDNSACTHAQTNKPTEFNLKPTLTAKFPLKCSLETRTTFIPSAYPAKVADVTMCVCVCVCYYSTNAGSSHTGAVLRGPGGRRPIQNSSPLCAPKWSSPRRYFN